MLSYVDVPAGGEREKLMPSVLVGERFMSFPDRPHSFTLSGEKSNGKGRKALTHDRNGSWRLSEARRDRSCVPGIQSTLHISVPC